MYKFAKNSIFIAIFVFLVCFAFSVSAAGLVPQCSGPVINKETGEKMCQPCDIFVGFVNIINFLVFTITPFAAAIMIVASGLILIFGGSESAKTMGKKMFTNTIVGLVIIFSSWLIINTIIRTIGRQAGTWTPTSWNTIQCVNSPLPSGWDRGGQD
jgi:hypothetical protein